MVEVVELTDDALLGRICKRLRKTAVSVLGGYLLAEFSQLTLFPRWSCSILITAWEQRKLGEVALVTMGQSPNGACYTDNPNDAVLVQGNADLKDGWVSPRVWTTEVTKTAKAGDLIMSVRAPVGAMGKTAYDVVLGRGVAGIAGNEFLFQALSKKEAEGYWSTVSAGSTFDSINGDELRNTLVDCPRSELECEAIGDCLSKVDSLITLHQRKRCNGPFTHPLVWEQRKLGELCTFSKGHGYSKADIRDAGTPLILYGRLYTQYESRIEEVDTFAVEQDGSILSRGNEVIVPASGETAEDIAVASSVRRSGIILGGDLNVVTPTSKLDPDYAALAITYSKAHDDLAKRAQGKSVVHVHGNDIAEVEVSYPSESEQKRISSVVLNLDSLITLHQ